MISSVLFEREVPDEPAAEPRNFAFGTLEHDPEKWIPVFGKDHAQTINEGRSI